MIVCKAMVTHSSRTNTGCVTKRPSVFSHPGLTYPVPKHAGPAPPPHPSLFQLGNCLFLLILCKPTWKIKKGKYKNCCWEGSVAKKASGGRWDWNSSKENFGWSSNPFSQRGQWVPSSAFLLNDPSSCSTLYVATLLGSERVFKVMLAAASCRPTL